VVGRGRGVVGTVRGWGLGKERARERGWGLAQERVRVRERVRGWLAGQ
jgi:hypothetical protein